MKHYECSALDTLLELNPRALSLFWGNNPLKFIEYCFYLPDYRIPLLLAHVQLAGSFLFFAVSLQMSFMSFLISYHHFVRWTPSDLYSA